MDPHIRAEEALFEHFEPLLDSRLDGFREEVGYASFSGVAGPSYISFAFEDPTLAPEQSAENLLELSARVILFSEESFPAAAAVAEQLSGHPALSSGTAVKRLIRDPDTGQHSYCNIELEATLASGTLATLLDLADEVNQIGLLLQEARREITPAI
ncbi:hypothetical protein [Nocardioides yefusunii]|uniref:Sensory transduction regulator n=1 Tax=Nocardioides yefusunii TaxID=2500546 RepID=A0ABW1QWG5_9ACTN|nr:hypothetical protein [Nocardioides yefusunii]